MKLIGYEVSFLEEVFAVHCVSVSPRTVRPSDVLLMAVAFKTTERTQYTGEATMTTIRRIIPKNKRIFSVETSVNQTSWHQMKQKMYLKGHQPVLYR